MNNLKGLKLRCQQGWLLLEAPEQTAALAAHKAACIPWLVAASMDL